MICLLLIVYVLMGFEFDVGLCRDGANDGGGQNMRSQSHKFKGICLSDTNCASVCKTEGFTGGDCKEMGPMVAEGRTCESQSQKFEGICLSDTNCGSVCKQETAKVHVVAASALRNVSLRYQSRVHSRAESLKFIGFVCA
ncbi:hypothetical protein GH714_001448 [Hevea brasiliensis]|uniref:Knottins-like domain-containing protein n=1 Tax=Hevea brasiliensis TaxID=3981 RepID=A0A6A6L5S8_HEVBR|nr:hypothetical protein GH714_001448 [Hevea brasiliensis]